MGLAAFAQAMLQRADSQATKSTALNPLGWVFATVLGALGVSAGAHASPWVLVMLGIFAAIVLVVYLIAYFYFMLRTPDALRSERYTLSKMVIERQMLGDSVHGFKTPSTKVTEAREPLALSMQASQPEETA